MELRLYLDILRRRWPLVAAVPLLVALVSAAAALMRPARYESAALLLVTRGDAPPGSTAGLTYQADDTTAEDLPAIVAGAPFRRDLAAELAERGLSYDEAALAEALRSGHQEHVVTIAAQTGDPADAPAIVGAAVDLVGRNGLRYWGDPNATPERPGLRVALLDPPEGGRRVNGAQAIAVDVALRTLLGFLAASGIAFLMHYLDRGPKTIDRGPRT
jgi:capsular polysaccharide biosynthesis protein